MRNIRVLLGIIVTAVLLQYCKSDSKNEPGAKNTKSDVIVVQGIVVKAETISNNIKATGTVMSNEQVDLISEINARIIKINFKEGQIVKKGDLLVKLFDADLQAQKSKLELQKKLAEEKVYRQKSLLQKGAISQEEFDINSNQLSTIDADLALIKSQIDKTEIRAPFNGVIGLRYASEGGYVVTSQKISSIVDNSQVKIEFSVPEKYAHFVKSGDVVAVYEKAMERKFSAVVYATAAQIDPATRSLQVRALASNASVIPGGFVEVVISVSREIKGILVPTEAIVPELKGQKVYILKEGMAIPQKVLTGIRTDVNVEVTDGLKEGDTVITRGVIKLKPQAKVKFSIVKD